jgi:hypothetical protein
MLKSANAPSGLVKLGMDICRPSDIRQQTFAANAVRQEWMKPLEHRTQN